MSSSATHSGTTPAVGGSGRGFGVAAVLLAVVIAAGVVVSVNQGNDGSATDVDALVNTRAAHAESDRYNAMAEYAFRNDPENLPSELKRIYEMIAAAEANNDPRHIVERQMAQSSEFQAAPTGIKILGERLAHEFLEDQRTPQNQGNPLERIAR